MLFRYSCHNKRTWSNVKTSKGKLSKMPRELDRTEIRLRTSAKRYVRVSMVYRRWVILGLTVFQMLIPVSGICLLPVSTVIMVILYLSKIPYLCKYRISVKLSVFSSFQPRIVLLYYVILII